jgi:transposase
MGKRNNQGFVQIPTGRLKERIQQLALEVNIQFVETEESYTSRSSFLDGDNIPVFGEKPEGWQPSGKRGERRKGDKKNRLGRGTYRTANGTYINADLNGAANILAKVATQLGLSLAEVGRRALTLVKRYDVFKSLKKSYRKHCEACLQTA